MFGADTFDTAVAYAFAVKIDGLEVPHVMEVSGLKGEVDKIEVKEQLADGKYKVALIPGRHKAGEITVKRGLTENPAVQSWLDTVMTGDVGGARKNVAVEIKDYKGATVKTYEFQQCWVKSIEWSAMKAGGTEPVTESFVIAYETWSIA